jgi:hypothetical protein
MKLTLLLVLAAGTAAAQKTNWANVKGLPVGGEIRVSLDGGRSYRGQVQNVTDESLVMVAASSQESLARAQIMKVATKGENHRIRNTFIGLAAGAGGGAGIGAGLDAQCPPRGCFISNNLGKEILTPIGAVVGTLIGIAWPTGLWHEIYRSK